MSNDKKPTEPVFGELDTIRAQVAGAILKGLVTKHSIAGHTAQIDLVKTAVSYCDALMLEIKNRPLGLPK